MNQEDNDMMVMDGHREWFEMAEAGIGEGRVFGASNQNQHLIFSKAQMQAYPNLPSFQNTIF